MIVQGTVEQSFVSHDDFPTTHNNHDQNFRVTLDSKYQGYNSDANVGSTTSKTMGMEWEINDFPKEFWPSAV